jgi:carbonic anhydrase/acetyltransferase-like protein (isoleucine patch superfamily)
VAYRLQSAIRNDRETHAMPIYALGTRRPQLDPQCWVAPTAIVIGDVRLARNASIWWNATLRGDNDPISIGENSNIQDNSVLHTDEGVPLTSAATSPSAIWSCCTAAPSATAR